MSPDHCLETAGAEPTSITSVSRRSLLRAVGAGAATSLLAGASSTTSGADDGSWTIVVLPDTQYYAEKDWLDKYAIKQTDWIAENADAENIVFVTHEGDIVQEGDETDQWELMDEAMATLDGVVHYSALPGNHDYAVTRDRISGLDNYTEYFGASRFDGYDWYGGTGPGDEEANSYQLFSAGGYDFLHLALEWEPRDVTLDWAQDVLDQHPERPTILTTHAYLTDGDKYDGNEDSPGRTRYIEERNGDGNSGEQVWLRLVSPNPQVFMVLNGHYHEDDGEYHQVSENSSSQSVFEMLANYQGRKNRGDSLLRRISFEPGNGGPDRIRVRTYNPYNDEYEDDANSKFEFDLDFDRRFTSDSSIETVSFQQDSDSYEGTRDTNLREANPEIGYGDALTVTVDTAEPHESDDRAQALVRFDNIIGDGDGKIPPNATVKSATLTVETVDEGSGGSVHRLLSDWDESDTWASLGGGITADGSDATADAEWMTGPVPNGTTAIDVTAGVRAWADGEPNHGWAILPLGDDGWDFSTAERETPPLLTVTFEPSDGGEDDGGGGDGGDDGDDGGDDGGGSDGGDGGDDDGEDGSDGGGAGDVNDDGRVNDTDVDLAQRHVANEDVDIDREAADMNGDGEIDITDVVEIVDEKGSE